MLFIFVIDLITLALKILSLCVLLQEHRVDVREKVPLVMTSNHFAIIIPTLLAIMTLRQER